MMGDTTSTLADISVTLKAPSKVLAASKPSHMGKRRNCFSWRADFPLVPESSKPKRQTQKTFGETGTELPVSLSNRQIESNLGPPKATTAVDNRARPGTCDRCGAEKLVHWSQTALEWRCRKCDPSRGSFGYRRQVEKEVLGEIAPTRYAMERNDSADE
jgi:hypothetical protein